MLGDRLDATGGKTEAAWFPVLSRILTDGGDRIGVLCVTPLKALIDDQLRRLSSYGEHLDLAIVGWHGDVPHARKTKVLQSPPSGLVITPESLQGLLLRRQKDLLRALESLRYVIVDEVHAFAGTDRGHQVQSLLDRLDVHLHRRIPRIALSATVSDVDRMKEYFRLGDPDSVVDVVESVPRKWTSGSTSSRGLHRSRMRTRGAATRPTLRCPLRRPRCACGRRPTEAGC